MAADAWRDGDEGTGGKRPNVVAKLSGLGTFMRRNDPDHIQSDR